MTKKMTRQQMASFRFFHRKKRKVPLWEALMDRRPVICKRNLTSITFDLRAYKTARAMDRRFNINSVDGFLFRGKVRLERGRPNDEHRYPQRQDR